MQTIDSAHFVEYYRFPYYRFQAHDYFFAFIGLAKIYLYWAEGKSDQVTEEQWDETMVINAKGPCSKGRYAISLLEKSGGVIFNVNSDAGLIGHTDLHLTKMISFMKPV